MRRSSTARAAQAAVALAGVYAAFGLTRTGAVLDESLRAARDDTGMALTRLALDLLSTINPATLVAATILLALLGWRRAGPRGAAAAAVGISLAVGVAESLKAFLPNMHHRGGSGVVLGGSFPSGHVTIATVLALTALSTVTPRTRRLLRGPAVVLPALIAVATVMAGWHRPSDAVAGVLTGILAHQATLAILHMDTVATGPDTISESGRWSTRSATRRTAVPMSVRPSGAWSWTFAFVGCAAAVRSYQTGLPDSWSEPGLVAYVAALAAVPARRARPHGARGARRARIAPRPQATRLRCASAPAAHSAFRVVRLHSPM